MREENHKRNSNNHAAIPRKRRPSGVVVALGLALAIVALTAGGADRILAAVIATTTSASSSPNPTVTNQGYSVNWTVSPTPGGGTVTTTIGGTNACSQTASSGSSACTITTASNASFLSAGSKNVQVSFGGFVGASDTWNSSSTSFTHTVNKANTTTTITNATSLTNNSTAVGEAYTVSYSVVGAFGNTPWAPTGTVTVSDGVSSNSCSVGAGSCSLTSIAVGLKSITATYNGDGNFNADASPGVNHTVTKGTTTTSITSSLSTPSVVGQPVAVSWTVSPAAATGEVTVDGGNSCTAAESAGQCSVTWTSPGSKSVTAEYKGDANYFGSISTAVSHTVNKADTSITITNAGALAGANATNDPHTVEWSVTVDAPGSGTPTGLVSVTVNGILGCSALVNSNDNTGTTAVEGRCTVSGNFAGDWNFTAHYQGDVNFNASDSLGVPKSDTTTTITNALALQTPSDVGQQVTVQWSVSPSSGPTGNVNVKSGATQLCSAAVGAGQCSFTPSAPAILSLVATYEGDANFNDSSSSPVVHGVDRLPTTTNILSVTPASPTTVGQQLTVAWEVLAGSLTPTGTVTVRNGLTTLCSAPVADGECSFTPSAAAALSIIARYGGDTSLEPSASSAVAHTVNPKTGTTTTITGLDLGTPTTVGSPYTVQFSVTNGTPGTNVRVIELFGGVECTATVATGQCQITPTRAGFKILLAIYQGDTTTNSSFAIAFHVVRTGP